MKLCKINIITFCAVAFIVLPLFLINVDFCRAAPVDETAELDGEGASSTVLEDLDKLAEETKMPNASGGVSSVLNEILIWVLRIFLILSIITFIISGIIYVTSTGNETQIDNAKKAMTWSIVGVVVGLSGVIIIRTIETLLR